MRFTKLLALVLSTFCFLNYNSTAETKLKELSFAVDTLANGLTVIYHVDRTAPIASTVMYYRVGSKDELPGKTGYAHFFEHLMFEATAKIKRGEMDVFTQEAAGNLNAYTSFDETVYFVKVPNNYVKLPLWIESQRMRQLKIESIGVETQRGVVIEEKKQRYDNSPYGLMMLKMIENLFPENYYAWSPIGDVEHIEKASIQDFKTFYDSYYVPNNAILVVTGDIKVPEIRKVINAYFSNYPKKENIVRRDSIVPLNVNPIDEKILDKHASMPGLFIGYRGVPYYSKDYFAMELLTNILSDGESSRLYKKLVLDEELALDFSISFIPMQMSGFNIFNVITHQKTNSKTVRDEIDKELESIAKNGVSQEELKKAINQKEAGIIFKRADLLATSIDIAKAYVYHGSPNFLNKEIEMYKKVTVNDIKRVASEYFNKNRRVILNFVPDNNN